MENNYLLTDVTTSSSLGITAKPWNILGLPLCWVVSVVLLWAVMCLIIMLAESTPLSGLYEN